MNRGRTYSTLQIQTMDQSFSSFQIFYFCLRDLAILDIFTNITLTFIQTFAPIPNSFWKYIQTHKIISVVLLASAEVFAVQKNSTCIVILEMWKPH